ncbi:carboxymuconolactone decarboxylase family protein [Cohnella pontilimi]|uniref:Carboxymuconolactone decarboxylase family protein n=1 Tax=Cohnella pontilimi TaxID=2564100 RepID=A0A4V6WEG3_9BACL|nr:carboxymuconolactone decarboxylase family protein [Cohnella pontilimi]
MSLMEQKVRNYKEEVAGLAQSIPDVAEAYHRFTGECFAPGELDERTKQLIALGVSLYANNEICSFYHVQEARSKGASDRQIMEAAAVAAAAAGGHVLSQGVTRVQGALQVGRYDGPPLQMYDTAVRMDGASGMQDYLRQDTEFAEEWEPGQDLPGGISMSPSY